MAPRFLTSLVPRRELREGGRPLIEVLKSLTWIQWAQFWSGTSSYAGHVAKDLG